MLRKRGLCLLSFFLGVVALPAGVIALVREGSIVGAILMLAGMALIAQSLECFQ